MRKMRSTERHWLCFTCILIAWVDIGMSCQVPVFRYALERWTSDQYVVEVSAGDPASPALDLLKNRSEGQTANFTLSVTGESPAQNEVKLFRPRQPENPIWTGPFNEATVAAVIDSPTRRQLVKDILSGVSVVWVFLPGKDPAVNETARKALQSTLDEAKQKIKIPDGVVTHDQVSEGQFSGDPDDIIDGDIPLKIDFSILEVARDDPAEAAFVDMLLSIEDDLHEFTDSPMLFPVFGRGRFLEPLIGRGITRDTMLSYCVYLCGACACEVKHQNPGMDLLIATNWKAADAATVTADTKAAEPKPETVHFESTKPASTVATTFPTARYSLTALAVVLLLLGSFLLFKRADRKSKS